MATYYVATTGNDNNPGTEAEPFATPQKAASTVGPGDTVIFEDGVYTSHTSGDWNANMEIVASGTANNWITFKARNKHQAIFDGNNFNVSYNIRLNRPHRYVRIEGFTLRHSFHSSIRAISHTISGEFANDMEIIGNRIHDIGRVVLDRLGIGIAGIKTDILTRRIHIEGNIIYNIGRLPGGTYPDGNDHDNRHDHGWYAQGKNHTFRNNLVYNCEAGWCIKIDGHWSHNELAPDEFTHTIENNYFDQLPNRGIAGGWIRPYNNGSYSDIYGKMKDPRYILSGNYFFGDPKGTRSDFQVPVPISTNRSSNFTTGTIMQNNIVSHNRLYSSDPEIANNITDINNTLNAPNWMFAEWDGESPPDDPGIPDEPIVPVDPEAFSFDPDTKTVGHDPIWAGDFSLRGDAITATVISEPSPYGDKIWRLTPEVVDERSPRVLYFEQVPSDALTVEVLVVYRVNHISFSQALPYARLNKTGNETGYVCGVTAHDKPYSFRRYVNGVRTNLSSDILPENFIVNEWLITRFKASGSVLEIKTWVAGEPEPVDYEAAVNDSVIEFGGAGLRLWLNDLDYDDEEEEGTEPVVDIAWYSVGVEGVAAPMPDEVETPIVVEKKVFLSESANIATGGTTNTTAQLTAPGTKTTTDFTAGKISDDTNPLPSITIGSGEYTEVEFSFELATSLFVGDEIEFRVTSGGNTLSDYTQVPKITIIEEPSDPYVPPPIPDPTPPLKEEPDLKRGVQLYTDIDGETRTISTAIDMLDNKDGTIDHENDLVMFCDSSVENGQKEKGILPGQLFTMPRFSVLGNIKGEGVSPLKTDQLLSSDSVAGFQSRLDKRQTSVQSLVDAASITWDISRGGVGIVTLKGNRSIGFSNASPGRRYTLIIKQDTAGNKILTFSSGFKFAGGTAPSIALGSGEVTVLEFRAETESVLHCIVVSSDSK